MNIDKYKDVIKKHYETTVLDVLVREPCPVENHLNNLEKIKAKLLGANKYHLNFIFLDKLYEVSLLLDEDEDDYTISFQQRAGLSFSGVKRHSPVEVALVQFLLMPSW